MLKSGMQVTFPKSNPYPQRVGRLSEVSLEANEGDPIAPAPEASDRMSTQAGQSRRLHKPGKRSGHEYLGKGIQMRNGAMQKGSRRGAWLRYIMVAVLYCLLVSAVRQISISHWLILSGLYLSVLLLTSYRYWPALMIGECASLAHLSYTCGGQFGTSWALFNLVPSLLFVAPVVYWARERGGIFAKPRTVNIGTLLVSALIIAFIITFRAIGALMLTRLPPGYPVDYRELAAR